MAQPIFRLYQARIQSAGRMNQREVIEPDIFAPASNDSLTHTESVPPTAHHRLPPRQHSMRRPRLTRGGPLTGVLALVLALLPIVACSRPHLHDLLPPSATPSAVVMANPNQVDLVKIAMLAPNDGWAVGAQGTILHYNGVSWSPVISPTDTDLLGISMASPNEGWAVHRYGVADGRLGRGQRHPPLLCRPMDENAEPGWRPAQPQWRSHALGRYRLGRE